MPSEFDNDARLQDWSRYPTKAWCDYVRLKRGEDANMVVLSSIKMLDGMSWLDTANVLSVVGWL